MLINTVQKKLSSATNDIKNKLKTSVDNVILCGSKSRRPPKRLRFRESRNTDKK